MPWSALLRFMQCLQARLPLQLLVGFRGSHRASDSVVQSLNPYHYQWSMQPQSSQQAVYCADLDRGTLLVCETECVVLRAVPLAGIVLNHGLH